MNSTDKIVVLTTASSHDKAHRIADVLVEAGLAACVNIVPGISSIYRWKGEVCRDAEFLLLIKSRGDLFAALCGRIREVHDYDCPEIVALPIVEGFPDYLAWIDASLSPDGES